MLTLEKLIAAGIGPTQARIFVPLLQTVPLRFAIDRPIRLAALVAQCRHESAGFTRLEESLYYTDPSRIARIFSSKVRSIQDAIPLAKNPRALANRVYSNRLGNGNEASGDGWKYRGRGLIQLTGRELYAKAGAATGGDWLMNPDMLAQPIAAVESACWYFQTHGGNSYADASNIDGITRSINPAMLGRDERRNFFEQALEAFQ